MCVLDIDNDGKVTFAEFTQFFTDALAKNGKKKTLTWIEKLENKVWTNPALSRSTTPQTPISRTATPPQPSLVRGLSNPSTFMPFVMRACSIFTRIDTNRNQMLELAELDALMGEGNNLKAGYLLKDMDKDHDGKVSPAEFIQYFQKKYKTSGLNAVQTMLSNLEKKLSEKENKPTSANLPD